MKKVTRVILALLEIPGVGIKSIEKIMRSVADIGKLADYSELETLEVNERPFFEKAVAKGQLSEDIWLNCLEKAQAEIEGAELNGVRIINSYENDYSKLLKLVDGHPPILYVKGNVSLLNDDKIVAVIGTRKPTGFGEKMTDRVTRYLAEADYTIVSGLAVGCDSIAHHAAVEVSGKTVAVLAHGLARPIYPSVNSVLADRVVEAGGALVSTYSMNKKAYKSSFVERDKWQMGLSQGVFLGETTLKGGSNHAARAALEYSRPLAVLDHWKHVPLAGVMSAEIEGNRKYIEEEDVFPVFTEDSLEKFIKAMENLTK